MPTFDRKQAITVPGSGTATSTPIYISAAFPTLPSPSTPGAGFPTTAYESFNLGLQFNRDSPALGAREWDPATKDWAKAFTWASECAGEVCCARTDDLNRLRGCGCAQDAGWIWIDEAARRRCRRRTQGVRGRSLERQQAWWVHSHPACTPQLTPLSLRMAIR